jgi:Ca-activated chloride channel homolog
MQPSAIGRTGSQCRAAAESAEQLTEVFAQLPTDLILRHEVVEISVVFTAVGVVLVALAIILGQAWRQLP